MDRSRYRRLRELFAAVVGLPAVSQRSRLRVLAADDLSLVDEVMALLEAHVRGDRSLLAGLEAAAREVLPGAAAAPADLAANMDVRVQRLQRRRGTATDRYRCEDEIGRGGMGRVLRVHDLDLRRDLAMKVIRGGTADADRARRFLDEAEITGQLDHPGVVPVHDIGVDDDGQLFFTMRIVRGETVDVVFAAARAGLDGWTRTRALEVVLRVCDTMAFAHDKGVIHRDLKPSNVMVGKFGEVYVVDWGLAKVVGRNDAFDLRVPSGLDAKEGVGAAPDDQRLETTTVRTMDGTVMGTPSFMPPEQALGNVAELDQRADVYAIGAMLYQLLTGSQPYAEIAGGRAREIVDAVRAGPPVAVRAVDPAVPKELAAVCAKAMERDLPARYQSVRDLSADLRAYLDQRVVQAYRTGIAVRVRLWLRRNRTLAAVSAAALLVAVAAAWLVRSEWAVRVEEERKRVEAERQAEAERIEGEDAKRKARSTKLAASREQRRVREAAQVGGEQRKVLDLAERLLAADDRIVGLACASASGASGIVDDPILRGSLERIGEDVAAGDRLPWGQWARARFLSLCADDAADAEFRHVPRRGPDGGLEWLLPTEPIERDPRPVGSLFFGLRAQIAAEQCRRRRQWLPAVAKCLEVIDEVRRCSKALELVEADRGPLRSIALSTARSLASVLDEPTCFADQEVQRVVDAWLATHDTSLGRRTSEPMARLDPEVHLVRSACFARAGRLEEALAEAQMVAASAPLATWVASLKLRAGAVSDVLVIAAKPDDPRIDRLHEFARIEATVQSMRQRPHAAIDVLRRDLARLPTGGAFAWLRVESLEQMASLASATGDHELAVASLQAACDLLAEGGESWLRLQLQLIRVRFATGADVGPMLSGLLGRVTGDGASLAVPFASLAMRAGRSDLAESFLATAPESPGKSTLAMAIDQLRPEPSKAIRNAVERLVENARRKPLLPAWCLTAQLLLVRDRLNEGDRDEAWRGLERAAAMFERRLAMHSWGGRASRDEDPLEVEPLLVDAQSALSILASMAPIRDQEEVARVWPLLVVAHRLRDRVALMRSFDVGAGSRGKEADPRSSTMAEMERQWLASGSQQLPLPDLTRSFERLRSDAPALANLQFPRIPKLRDVQSALSGDSAIVLMVAVPAPMVAVITRTTAEIVPTPLTSIDLVAVRQPAGAVGSATFGAAVLGPVMQSVATQVNVRKLLLVPDDPWLAVPFEWCRVTVGGDGATAQPLIQRFDVGYAHTVDLWLEQAKDPWRSEERGGGEAFVAEARPDLAHGWVRALLSGVAREAHECAWIEKEPIQDGSRSGWSLRVTAGSKVTTETFAKGLVESKALALSLRLGAEQGVFPRFQLPGDEAWCTPQDLCATGRRCRTVLLHAAPADGAPASARVAALAAFARAFTATGAKAIWTITAAGEPTVEAAQRLREAVAAGGDPVAAWSKALRAHAESGADPAALYGIRLWASR